MSLKLSRRTTKAEAVERRGYETRRPLRQWRRTEAADLESHSNAPSGEPFVTARFHVAPCDATIGPCPHRSGEVETKKGREECEEERETRQQQQKNVESERQRETSRDESDARTRHEERAGKSWPLEAVHVLAASLSKVPARRAFIDWPIHRPAQGRPVRRPFARNPAPEVAREKKTTRNKSRRRAVNRRENRAR